MSEREKRKTDNSSIWRYAGLTGQFMLVILLSLGLGYKIDQYFHFTKPAFVWILPLLMIIGTITKLIIETGRKKQP